MHYAHISKVLSFFDVAGTLPDVMYTILVYLFCGSYSPMIRTARMNVGRGEVKRMVSASGTGINVTQYNALVNAKAPTPL